MPRNLRFGKTSTVKLQQFNGNKHGIQTQSPNRYNLKPISQDIELSRPNQQFYTSKAWLQLADEFKQLFPYCFRCGKTGVRLIADHVKEIRDFPELKLERSNIQCLCYQCHAIKTAEVKKERKKADFYV